MTDADALSDLVRVGLRNPARIVVKVRSKKVKTTSSDNSKVVEERRTPARFLIRFPFKAQTLTFRHSQLTKLLYQLSIFREVDPANAHNFA